MDGKWHYHAAMKTPDEGYLAFYIELKFDRKTNKGPNGLRLSSEMNILPGGYPSEKCQGDECIGRLV